MGALLLIGFMVGIAVIFFAIGYLAAANKYSDWIR